MAKKVPHRKFKLKLFFSVSTLFIFIALMVSFLFSITAIHNSKKTEISSSQIVLDRVSMQIDSLYEQMEIAATSIIKNNSLKQIVYELNTLDSHSSNQYMQQLSQKRIIQKTLINMMFSPIISNVILYNKSRDYFYYTGIYLSDQDYIRKALAGDKTYEVLRDNQNETLYQAPHSSWWTPSPQVVLSVCKNFSDALTTQETVVEIQVPYDTLKAICTQNSFGSEKEFLILDNNNDIVYPYNKKPSVLPESILREIMEKIKDRVFSEFQGGYAYYSVKSASTPFTTVLISNNETLRRQNASYIVTAVFTVLIVLTAALAIMFIIISFITKPLKQLITHIKTIGAGNDAILSLPKNNLDEFEVLNTSFNQMLKQLKQSIALNYELKIRESNANLAALQAQINPHFLYNTLNSISAASEIYGSGVTTKMCQDFSSMLRYINSKEQTVPLIQEINHTRNYLELMKISNDGNLDYDIAICPDLYNLPVPKLTIQPLVENCFKHGFQDSVPPWKVRIQCSLDGSFFTLIIEDNGLGFTKEALENLEEFQNGALQNQTFSYQDVAINGLGLCNTFARLYAQFDRRFAFTIENLPQGSRITMKGEK